MYFYAQQVDIDKVSGSHVAILDVANVEDHIALAQVLGSNPQILGQNTPADQASMVRLTYIPSSYKGIREGSWYDIEPEVLKGAQYELVNSDSEGGLYLRANLVGNPIEDDFSQFLASPRVASVLASNFELVVEPYPSSYVTLKVVDCGHGNWNEIITATDRVIYDLGADRCYNESKVRALVVGQGIVGEKRSISVVISHWDIDHYHAILGFSSAELAKIRVVFIPSQVPDTATFRRVLKRLNYHNVGVVKLQPAYRASPSRKIVLEVQSRTGIFTLFRATSGRSRNQTGIVVGVRGSRAVALLTGDHHYEKVLAGACKVANYHNHPCVLVTPHHGGLAGKPCAASWLTFFQTIETPISCGRNSYGHPVPAVEAELRVMQGGVVPPRTCLGGTWTTQL